MKMKLGAVLILTFCSIAFISESYADKLCLKVSFNKAKQKVTTASTVAATCPSGYKELVDTSSFVGPQGATGASGTNGTNGTNGSNGTNGFVPLSQCDFGTITGSSCAEGSVCTTTLSCGDFTGSSANEYMIAWDFSVSNNGAYLVEALQLVPTGSEYPSGISIKTTSEDTFGAHIPELTIFCCPNS